MRARGVLTSRGAATAILRWCIAHARFGERSQSARLL